LAILNVENDTKSSKLGDFNSFLLLDVNNKSKKKDILDEEIRVTALRFITINKMRSRLLDWEIEALETTLEYERNQRTQKALNPE